MIIQIEDTLGNTIGSILLNTSAFDEFNDTKAFERVDGDISIADVDFDDILNDAPSTDKDGMIEYLQEMM